MFKVKYDDKIYKVLSVRCDGRYSSYTYFLIWNGIEFSWIDSDHCEYIDDTAELGDMIN